MGIFAVLVAIVVFFISLAIVRWIRNLFMKLIGAKFMLVNPVTTIIATIVLTVVTLNFIGLLNYL